LNIGGQRRDRIEYWNGGQRQGRRGIIYERTRAEQELYMRGQGQDRNYILEDKSRTGITY